MEIYLNQNNPEHRDNVAMFERLRARFDWMTFYQPNPQKAPWHIQIRIECATGEDIFLNFWPHKGKAQRNGCRTVEGEEAIRLMIAEAIEDSTGTFDLMEDFHEQQSAHLP